MKYNVNNRAIIVSWSDACTISILLFCLFIGNVENSNNIVNNNVITISLLLYLTSILSFTLAPLISDIILQICILCLCLYESGLGVLQLLGEIKSYHYLFPLSGSFDNPGPYGGFLSICISTLVAYYIKAKDNLIHVHRMALIVAVIAFVILPSTQSRSAILSLGISLILLALGTDRLKNKIRPIIKKFGILLLLGLTTLIVGLYFLKKPSADGRLFMDRINIMTMCNNGLRGGRGHFGGAYGETQAIYFQKQISENGKDDLDWSAINEHDRITADCPDNAFNEYLFLGVEAGPIAMLLFIIISITAIAISFKRGTIWCYGMTAFSVFAMFSYPLHIKQFQILIPIMLAACVSDRKQNIQDQIIESKVLLDIDTSKLLRLVTFLVLLLTSSYYFVLNIPNVRKYKQAEISWKKAERWHIMEYYEYVVEDCDTLLPYLKNDQHFLFAYGHSLNKIGLYEKSDSILKLGTEISSDPMFWNVMGNNSLAMGRYREAEERYKHAFYMVPNRLYPLTLLAKLYHTEGDTIRFLNMANKVETFVPKIENANTERLRAEIREIREGYNIEAIKKDEEQ